MVNFAEQGLMSKALATINVEVPVEFNEEELRAKEPDLPALMSLFEELEFKTFAKRFLDDYKRKEGIEKPLPSTQEGLAPSGELDLFSQEGNNVLLEFSDKGSAKTTPHNYRLVTTDADIEALVKELSGEKQFVFDTETTNVDVYSAELVGLSFAIKAH